MCVCVYCVCVCVCVLVEHVCETKLLLVRHSTSHCNVELAYLPRLSRELGHELKSICSGREKLLQSE